jgi:hypothetical protein
MLSYIISLAADLSMPRRFSLNVHASPRFATVLQPVIGQLVDASQNSAANIHILAPLHGYVFTSELLFDACCDD